MWWGFMWGGKREVVVGFMWGGKREGVVRPHVGR